MKNQLSQVELERRQKENAAFRAYMCGRPDKEVRDLLAGTETISYTQGAAGGFIVPTDFYEELTLGLAQTDPLLNKDVVTLVPTLGYGVKPIPLPGWDLSTLAAVRLSEGAQQLGQAIPTVAGKVLNGYAYKVTLPASFEIEEDAWAPTIEFFKRAMAIAFARGIGVDLVNGTGSNGQPQGLLTGAQNSGYTTLTPVSGGVNALVIDDFNAIYTSVDRIYRQSPKCGWVMSDTTYKAVRNARDNSGRPLLDQSHDREKILDKNVYVSPSMPSGPGSRGIIFGDLSHFVVRVSQMVIQRSMQSGAGPGSVERGEALYHGRMRADSVVFNPVLLTSPLTALPPIVYATLHS